jgi:hypothetical protein
MSQDKFPEIKASSFHILPPGFVRRFGAMKPVIAVPGTA